MWTHNCTHRHTQACTYTCMCACTPAHVRIRAHAHSYICKHMHTYRNVLHNMLNYEKIELPRIPQSMPSMHQLQATNQDLPCGRHRHGIGIDIDLHLGRAGCNREPALLKPLLDPRSLCTQVTSISKGMHLCSLDVGWRAISADGSTAE